MAGRKRSEAEFSDGHFTYPEFCDVAPAAAGGRATEQNEGLPARILQMSEHGALAPAERFCRTLGIYEVFLEAKLEEKFG